MLLVKKYFVVIDIEAHFITNTDHTEKGRAKKHTPLIAAEV